MYGPQRYLLFGPLQKKFDDLFTTLFPTCSHQLIMGMGGKVTLRSVRKKECPQGEAELSWSQGILGTDGRGFAIERKSRGRRNGLSTRYGETGVVRKRKHRVMKGPEYRRTQATWGGSSSKVQGWPRPRMGGPVEFSASRFPTESNYSCFEIVAIERSGDVLVVEIDRLFLEFPNCECKRYP